MTILHRLFGKQDAHQTAPLPGRERGCARSRVCVGAASDRGQERAENEDAFLVLSATVSQEQEALQLAFCAVADGMGGQQHGQVASTLAVRSVADWVMERIMHPFLGDPEGRSIVQPISEVLSEAIAAANHKVRRACPNGGTTLTCAFVLGNNAFVAHVGDSRAYMVGPGTIDKITTDHSMANRLVEVGQISEQEARTHPQRNLLYRALGRPGDLQVDTHLQALPDNGGLLLCSDGLWSVVPESDMLSIIEGAPSAQDACRALVARANACGGKDNITALLVHA